jgi:hypothetical protein
MDIDQLTYIQYVKVILGKDYLNIKRNITMMNSNNLLKSFIQMKKINKVDWYNSLTPEQRNRLHTLVE